jgi:CRP-like cAMP-binding protein
MELKQILRNVMLFASLSEDELEAVASICSERKLKRGEILVEQGAIGDEFYVVMEGFMEVSIQSGDDSRAIVNMGKGQIIGEMALIDHGPRSATLRAVGDPTVVQVIKRDAFIQLCEANNRIGYLVMKDIAADLSFKLRHRNMSIG